MHAYDLVVIGASAGGIEALSLVVEALSSDFPAALVIAQHLDPNHLSHLGEILARHTSLPVRTVTDQEPLLPGVIYVVPADRDVEITDHKVRLLRNFRSRPKPSVNRLFSSAASAHGERLVGVILTGSGSDGAIGARDIKAAGGMVLIENPATAAHASMPLALAPSTVDLVADLAQIGPLLADLVAGSYIPSQADVEATLPILLEQLRQRSGVDFSAYKTPTILRRLQRRLMATGMNSLSNYLNYLTEHPEEYQQLLSSFLIKVTEFFRDADLFKALRDDVLPNLIAYARRSGEQVRCWSAGCATGEEAYSLAILFAEALGEDLEHVPVRIFATDLDADAIDFARRGIYAASALTTIPPDLIERSFIPIDGAFEVAAPLRRLVIFGQHDLGQRAPFPHIDLVLCRNVLIYFTPELQRRTLQLFAFALRDGGFLALGKAETPQLLAPYFTEAHATLKIYQRKGGKIAVPPARLRPDLFPQPPLAVAGWRPQTRTAQALSSSHMLTTSEKVGSLVMGLPLGVVVVDRRYDIQAINIEAQHLLGILRAAVGADLIHLVAPSVAAPLRATIDMAFSHTIAQAECVMETVLGEMRHLHLAAYPQYSKMSSAPNEDLVFLLITDVTIAAQAEKERRTALATQSDRLENVDHGQFAWEEESQRLTGQIAQMALTNRDLLVANQELARTNLTLTGMNEELLVRNEELQTATEEIKTLNEELQATNEELETLNEEQEATVEELKMTNDDLQVRSAEVLHLAGLQAEQQRISEAKAAEFAAILLSMGDALLVLDQAGRTRFTNPAYVAAFGDEFAVFHAEDDVGNLLPVKATPQRRAIEGRSFRMTFTLPTPDGERRWFEATSEPILIDGRLSGGILTFRDITDRSLRRLQDEFLTLASHELRGPLTAILAAAQMIQRKLPNDVTNETIHDYLQIIVRQERRQERLIDDLMDLGRLQHGKLQLLMEPVDLRVITVETVAIIALGMPVPPIVIEQGDVALPIRGDAVRLEQILTNLLINAGKYAAASKQITVRLRRLGDDVELEVEDSGPGIAPDALPHLFQRFYQIAHKGQLQRQGLGLGLYIVHELVVAHQGAIDVRSVVGQGTTFSLRFPLLREGVVSPHEDTTHAEGA